MVRRNTHKTAWMNGLIGGGLLIWVVCSLPVHAQSTANYVGSEVCLECHEDFAESFARNVHGRLSNYQNPGEGQGCESCHGPGAAHVESNEAADIIGFDVDMGEPATDICMTCHRTGTTFNWMLGPHANNDVSCIGCHQLHGNEAKHAMLHDSQPNLCFSCHEDVKSLFYLPSFHPLKEGFMVCTNCHDPHNDVPAYVQEGETSRDMCLTCHMEYQGPFIFEHSPVMEDCMICHNPHGSVANNLLRQNEPFLCLQCHQPHFHSGLEAIDGDYSPNDPPDLVVDDYPPYGELSGTSQHDSFKRVMLTRCSQCHQAIHGSDLPSQSIPGQGRALNR